mgnify:FL=1
MKLIIDNEGNQIMIVQDYSALKLPTGCKLIDFETCTHCRGSGIISILAIKGGEKT